MADLLLAAARVLEDDAVAPAFKSVAYQTLSAAIGEGLIVPTGAARLLWKHVQRNASTSDWSVTDHLGSLPDPDVRQEALLTLFGRAGEDERDLAIRVLCGDGHACLLSDEILARLVDRVRNGSDARMAQHLVEAVHRARGVPFEVLRAIRDRFAASRSPEIREVSVAIACCLPEPDLAFVERMLGDRSADVRFEMAHALGGRLSGRELAGDIMRARLEVETHPEPRAALLHAQAELTHTTKRLVRR